MKHLGYSRQFIILVVWILIVVLLFRFISEKQLAALIAGSGFILLPLIFLLREIKFETNRLYIGSLILFLVLSALPIFFLRVFNWGEEFNTLSLLGVPAELMHRYSNILYLFILLSCAWQWRHQKNG